MRKHISQLYNLDATATRAKPNPLYNSPYAHSLLQRFSPRVDGAPRKKRPKLIFLPFFLIKKMRRSQHIFPTFSSVILRAWRGHIGHGDSFVHNEDNAAFFSSESDWSAVRFSFFKF